MTRRLAVCGLGIMGTIVAAFMWFLKETFKEIDNAVICVKDEAW